MNQVKSLFFKIQLVYYSLKRTSKIKIVVILFSEGVKINQTLPRGMRHRKGWEPLISFKSSSERQ